MRVISYTATLPRKEQYNTEESLKNATDKLDTLRYFAQGVNALGDQGIIESNMNYQPSEVAVILGWVHEHGKTSAHLQFRQQILDGQRAAGGRTVIADSNLFLYKNKQNPGYWLRYSYDGIFANTGEYCDHVPNPSRWARIQEHYHLQLQPWRQSGNHILLCLQRDGGWSMAGWDVVDWAIKTIVEIRKYSDRPIRIRPHPGDKRASKYCDRLLKLCQGRRLTQIELSQSAASLMQDFVNCWAVVNHNSSPGVAAAMEGIPVILTDSERSQARDVATQGINKIETPFMPDREAWAQRISQFHCSHEELRTGVCWSHMKKWAIK
jgi:hypothetical protein